MPRLNCRLLSSSNFSAAPRLLFGVDKPKSKNPIIGVPACRARAQSGHAAAPSTEVNLRHVVIGKSHWRSGESCFAVKLQRISIVSNHIPLSSPGLSRRPRALKHGASTIEVAGTSPATTREESRVIQYDREPLQFRK